MFRNLALTVLFTALVTRAQVAPSVPGPGVVYKTGGTCHIEWNGDTASNTIWKDMSIELMTGSNFNMIHLTTVATGQDGTASGFFDHPCPDVIPNSAIYFYQFSCPASPTRAWTTRFTIAGADGSSVPPANPTQPGTGAKIPWGTGALKDPSTAVPPPAYITTTTPAGNNTVTPTSTTTSSTTTTPPVTLNTLPSTSTSTSTPDSSSSSSSAPTATANGTTTNQKSAAMGSIVADTTMWSTLAALTLAVSALGLSVLP